MSNLPKKYVPLVIGFSLATGIILGGWMAGSTGGGLKIPANKNKQKLINLISYIEKDYVDEVNIDSIVSVTTNSILEKLDPHSTYISKNDFSGVKERMRGNIVGIGISYYQLQDTIAVIHTLPNGPSKKAGLLPGDRILTANNDTLFGKNLTADEVACFIKGKIDTEVHLQVKRQGEPDLLDFTLKRDIVPIKSVDAGFMLNEELAYIKINRFSETTAAEFKHQLRKLKKQNPEGIILDLRNNTGGYLREAIEIADEFLEKNTPILFTKNRSGKTKESYAQSNGMFEEGKLYVLINEKTASASEVIAGAIQDNDRGWIIGRRSYGKGLVQKEMNLGDGSAVRLTTSRYYTPSGRSIQRPYQNGSKSYFNQYHHRFTNGELKEKDSMPINDSLQFETKNGRIVYGGGGIVPDVFVPQSNDLQNDYEFMYQGGVMDRFVFDFMEKNRSYYNQLSFEEFQQENEQFTQNMIQEFEDSLNELNFSYDFSEQSVVLQNYLKAVLAKQLFDDEKSLQIKLHFDPMVESVLKHYQKSEELNPI